MAAPGAAEGGGEGRQRLPGPRRLRDARLCGAAAAQLRLGRPAQAPASATTALRAPRGGAARGLAGVVVPRRAEERPGLGLAGPSGGVLRGGRAGELRAGPAPTASWGTVTAGWSAVSAGDPRSARSSVAFVRGQCDRPFDPRVPNGS